MGRGQRAAGCSSRRLTGPPPPRRLAPLPLAVTARPPGPAPSPAPAPAPVHTPVPRLQWPGAGCMPVADAMQPQPPAAACSCSCCRLPLLLLVPLLQPQSPAVAAAAAWNYTRHGVSGSQVRPRLRQHPPHAACRQLPAAAAGYPAACPPAARRAPHGGPRFPGRAIAARGSGAASQPSRVVRAVPLPLPSPSPLGLRRPCSHAPLPLTDSPCPVLRPFARPSNHPATAVLFTSTCAQPPPCDCLSFCSCCFTLAATVPWCCCFPTPLLLLQPPASPPPPPDVATAAAPQSSTPHLHYLLDGGLEGAQRRAHAAGGL